jgi:CheY-like chemotaxis protein
MAQILISGKDWSGRALLRAQLIEEGFDVEAFEDVKAGVERLWGSREMPSLLVVDLFESVNQVEDMATLSHWAKLLPIWLLAEHGTAGAGMMEGRGFERVLYRPLMVGKLVQEIKVRLAG